MYKSKENTKVKRYFNIAYPYIVTAAFLVLAIILILRHELWRDEVIAWNIAAVPETFSGFLRNITPEYLNPYLWNTILYAVSHHITSNVESIKIVHLILATANVFLIVKYSPFNKLIKTGIVFGYFFFYEYAIISRNYVLGILFIFLFCVLYKNKYKNLLFLSLVIFFMSQSSTFSLVISAFFAILLLFDLISNKEKRLSKLKISFSIVIVLIGYVLSYLQFGPRFWSGANNISSSNFVENTFGSIAERLPGITENISQSFVRSYLPIPSFNINFWNSNLITDSLDAGNVLIPIISAALFIFSIILIKKKYLFFYIASTLTLVFVAFLRKNTTRHFGHLLAIFLAFLWISLNEDESDYIFKKIRSGAIDILRYAFLGILIIASLIGTGVAFFYDYNYKFSSGKETAEFIQRNFEVDSNIIVGYDWGAGVAGVYLDKDIYFPKLDRFDRLVQFEKQEMQEVSSLEEVFIDANRFIIDSEGNVRQVIVLLTEEGKTRIDDFYNDYDFYKLDKEFIDSIVFSENSYLFINSLYDKEGRSQKVIEIDSSNFADFLININGCEMNIEDDNISVEVFNEDPNFEIGLSDIKTGPKEYMIIKFNFISYTEADFQLYYKYRGEPYKEKNSRTLAIEIGQNEINIIIPRPELIESIRTDPIDKNKDIVLQNITIFDY